MSLFSSPYEFIEHTADIKIKAFGKDLRELFQNAAFGMLAVMYGEDHPTAPVAQKKELILEAVDTDSLLVDWLSEVLFHSSVTHCTCPEMTILEITPHKLNAIIYLSPADAEKEIKAVTWNDLAIEDAGSHYTATITLDL